jgi:hypothetical protein
MILLDSKIPSDPSELKPAGTVPNGCFFKNSSVL